MLEITLQHKLESYYNIMTVLIQKTYRGYISRKKVFDFYKMKEWIQLISKFNFPKKFFPYTKFSHIHKSSFIKPYFNHK